MGESRRDSRREALTTRLRQLILMRETGPKRPAWHRARARLIWRIHEQLAAEPPSEEEHSDDRSEPEGL